jgi:hypothetical protein
MTDGARCGSCKRPIVPDFPARPDTYIHRDTGEEDCAPVSVDRAVLEQAVEYMHHRSTCGVMLAGSDCGSYVAPFCHRDHLIAKIKKALDA